MEGRFATKAMGHKAGNGATKRKRQEQPFVEEVRMGQLGPVRNIHPKQSNAANQVKLSFQSEPMDILLVGAKRSYASASRQRLSVGMRSFVRS